MSNETKVIEGWAWPDMVEDNCRIGYNMYASEIQGTIPATLIIGDKAMPMREVVKMLWEMIGEADEHSGSICEAIAHSRGMLHEGYESCPGIRAINAALAKAKAHLTPPTT